MRALFILSSFLFAFSAFLFGPIIPTLGLLRLGRLWSLPVLPHFLATWFLALHIAVFIAMFLPHVPVILAPLFFNLAVILPTFHIPSTVFLVTLMSGPNMALAFPLFDAMRLKPASFSPMPTSPFHFPPAVHPCPTHDGADGSDFDDGSRNNADGKRRTGVKFSIHGRQCYFHMHARFLDAHASDPQVSFMFP